MPLNEADTRAKLIDPALRLRGWTEDLVFREQTAGSIVLDGKRARRLAGRVDYMLRVRVNPGTPLLCRSSFGATASIIFCDTRTGQGALLCRRSHGFYGIAIAMYYNDHNPPHFHAQDGHSRAVIRIVDGRIIAGSLPPTAMRLVAQWALAHRSELEDNWARARVDQPIERIPGPDDDE